MSFPGFGTSAICCVFMVVETSPFSAWMSGPSAVTDTLVVVFATCNVTFRDTGGPNRTVAARLSLRKPSRDTVNVYLEGARKENRYAPTGSVFVTWVVPLELFLI